MTSEPFLKPRLTGARFSGGSIPLEVLSDFAVLSEMIVEVAKWKYREENPSRKRVPRGFADGISLKLAGIEEGSAIPVIRLAIATATLFAPSAQIYFEEARQAIIGAVGAAEKNEKITTHLPEKLLGYFDRFGRNLADGEAIELTDDRNPAPVRLTKETRRKLILASSVEEYTEETNVYGLVHEFDQRARTFQLTLPNGSILAKIPVGSPHYDTILEAHNGFREKLRVRVFGIGRFDRNDRLKDIESVEHVAILDQLDVRARIDELKLLKDGWLDGKGIALPQDGLNWLADSFDSYYSVDLPLPYLFPTPEGRILAEWSMKTWSLSLEVDLAKRTGEWHALNVVDDAEAMRSLDLTDSKEWDWMAKQISQISAESA